MEFLRNNWFWIAILVFFVWMHGSGAGCGGGHAGHGGSDRRPRRDEREPDDSAGHSHH